MGVQIDRKRFKKMFPSLAKELDGRRQSVAINSVRSDVRTGESASTHNFSVYTPDVIDFIRRCDTQQQAAAIIDYLEKQGEITRTYAQRLRHQLEEKGVRSFGAKKEDGYYPKQGGH